MADQQKIAQSYLKARDSGSDTSILGFLKSSSITQYRILMFLLAIVLAIVMRQHVLPVALFVFVAGSSFSLALRDLLWLSRWKTEQEFLNSVINWDKIEKLAKGKS